MRILAFEPFDTGSHRAVRESIQGHGRHDWVWITRPGRAWKWRMRTAALEMLDEAETRGVLDERVNAIFVTSLMSAADLRAALPPALRTRPLILSMHENQVAYPAGPDGPDERDVHFALTNLTSIWCADRVVWNSRWNLESFAAGIQSILARAPDGRLRDLPSRLEAKSTVVWPPVEPPPPDLPERGADEPGVLHNGIRVVWPHRWEHDKGTSELLDLAGTLSDQLDLRWTLLGERFDTIPPEMTNLVTRLGPRIEHDGFEPDRRMYWERLASCDWVLSTARHEFFGIAVVEALLAGCLPWLPQRLSYPELLPKVAQGLGPLEPPRHPAGVREAIREHLRPCLAPEAVRRLEVVIEDASRA